MAQKCFLFKLPNGTDRIRHSYSRSSSSCSCCRDDSTVSVNSCYSGGNDSDSIKSLLKPIYLKVICFSSSLIHAHGADLHSYTHWPTQTLVRLKVPNPYPMNSGVLDKGLPSKWSSFMPQNLTFVHCPQVIQYYHIKSQHSTEPNKCNLFQEWLPQIEVWQMWKSKFPSICHGAKFNHERWNHSPWIIELTISEQ